MRLFTFVVSFLLLSLSLFSPLPYGATPGYLAERERLVWQLTTKPLQLCKEPLIIVPHGEQFVVTATLRIRAQQKPPADAQSACGYWLLHRVPGALLPDGRGVLYDDGNETVSALVMVEELRPLLGRMASDERRRLLAANPHLRNALRSQPDMN